MLQLNEYEKIESWDVVVKTTDRTLVHGQGRELSCVGDLGLDLPYTATKRIDQALEEFYPCAWSEEDKKSYDVQDVIDAEIPLEPMKCRHCLVVGETTYNDSMGDAYCAACGEWQLQDG